jgi:hypothetical protein
MGGGSSFRRGFPFTTGLAYTDHDEIIVFSRLNKLHAN